MYGFMMPSNIIGNNIGALNLKQTLQFIGVMLLCFIVFIILYKSACYLRDKTKKFQIKNSTLQTLALIATSISTLSYLSLQENLKINFHQIIDSPNFNYAAIIFIGSFTILSILSYITKIKIKPINISIYGIIFIIGFTLYETPTQTKIEPIKPNITMKKIEPKKVIEVKKEEIKNVSNNPNIKIEMH